MKVPLPNVLASTLRRFFTEHLSELRGLSPHRVHSYRDSLALLLRFVAARRGCPVAVLDITDLDPDAVIALLRHLAAIRGNTATTRNVRLAAVHAFFRDLALLHPERLEQAQRVLAIPFKRARSQPVEYLEYAEIQAVLAAVERTSPEGERDYALLTTLFNTGARVQELVDVRASDLQLVKPFQVRRVGKGRKERVCPLWPQTAELLKAYCRARRLAPHAAAPLCVDRRGEPLTRFGVRYILAKYCARAKAVTPSLAGKRLHPHTMRHRTAVHLLQGRRRPCHHQPWAGPRLRDHHQPLRHRRPRNEASSHRVGGDTRGRATTDILAHRCCHPGMAGGAVTVMWRRAPQRVAKTITWRLHSTLPNAEH